MNPNQNNNDSNTTVTRLPNGDKKTIIFNPQTNQVTEIIEGQGRNYTQISTYNRNNPNSRSTTTTSNNVSSQYSFNNTNSIPMFPPGFPFNNFGNPSSMNMRMGNYSGMNMRNPFDNQINFDERIRGRNFQRNRLDLNNIFGIGNFDIM